MNKATELLKKAGTFYVATVEGDQPRVRPFGATGEIDGKTYICMNNTKKVYNQLLANGKAEICGMFDGMNWFRIWGTLKLDDNAEHREEMLKQNDGLRGMYKADDGLYAIFYFEDVHGKSEGFSGPIDEF